MPMNNKTLSKIISLLFLIIFLTLFMPRTLKLKREEVLLDGFTPKETLVVKISMNKIKQIKLNREIELSEYYDEYDTYYDSLGKVLDNGYSYLNHDYTLKKDERKLIVNINTKKSGIVLNNLSIKYNSDDKTTLRYDVETNLSSESSIRIEDKISKDKLKEKLRKYGYL